MSTAWLFTSCVGMSSKAECHLWDLLLTYVLICPSSEIEYLMLLLLC